MTTFLHAMIASTSAYCLCAQVSTTTTKASPEPGVHDMVLMLADGPIHMRFRIVAQGENLSALRQSYVQELKRNLDVDQDGKVSRRETAKHPLFTNTRRFDDNKFLDTLRSQKDYSDKELAGAVDRVAGPVVAFRQNNAVTEQDLSVFRVLDENESGLIERAEMRTAPARLALRDLDFDQCITFDEFTNQVASEVNMISLANEEPPASVHSELLRDASEGTLPARLVRRYDADRDARLSARELNWSPENCAQLDRDRDGFLSVHELSEIAAVQPELEFSVELSGNAEGGLQLIGGRLMHLVGKQQSRSVRLEHRGMALTIAFRNRDPLAEAERDARALFNTIDMDANGYIDRKEILERHRFQRYLFDAMDGDADDRVFAAEMFAYVKAYTQPATTSCQVTLFDTGNGFFQMLDRNGDGRISIRELRQCEEYLVSAAEDQQSINPSRMTRSYRIELQRGGVTLFGRVDRPEAEAPVAVQLSAVGPVWFQRMDRNGDGDLTWDEFLGPRDVFLRMDTDRDGLIDSQEAKAFERG